MYEGVYLYIQKFKRGQGFVTHNQDTIFADAKDKNQKLRKFIHWYLNNAKKDESFYGFAADAANALLEPDRTAALEALNKIFISKGLTRYSVMTTQYLGRVSTIEERERVAFSNLRKRDYKETRKAADLLPEPNRSKVLHRMFSISISEGNLDLSNDIARSIGRELSRSDLETILSVAIKEGALRNALEVAEVMNRSLTRNEAEDILEVLLKEGCLNESEKLLHYLGRKPTNSELRILLKSITDKGFYWHFVPLLNMFSGSKRTLALEMALFRFIDNGDLWNAQEIAGLIGRPLSCEELERILLVLFSKGDVKNALLVIKQMPESGRFQKVADIIGSSLKNEEFKIAHHAAMAILKM